jgi:hypothetical protein
MRHDIASMLMRVTAWHPRLQAWLARPLDTWLTKNEGNRRG